MPRRSEFAISVVAQHDLGVRHLVDRQQHVGRLAGRRILALEAGGVAFHAGEHAAEPLAALDRDRHLDPDPVAGVALEIGAPHQRPVHARRRDLEPVGSVDGIGDVEHRRQRARDRLAVLDVMVPSGRSAMIWTVQPARPETLTRTSR